jgi:2-polyprenyl-3-methyl-5-hydroxy-6-metoxy-1,4-benzoquinol methylase
MTDLTFTHRSLYRMLDAIPVTTRSLLDAGCGPGIIGALCRLYRSVDRQVGIDVHEPYLERARRHDLYDELIQRSLTDLPLPFGTLEFDVVTCIEVIEHLPRDQGGMLLAELERVGRRVVVSTPNWFFDQEPLDGNPHQRHLSLWGARDFQQRGYRVIGMEGMKLFGRHVPYLSTVLGPLTLRMPRLATMILCVRDVSDARA